ncbi:hypothetical protein F4778DRAFT_736940 [Xylariomycetidae sp. FL2044]|nr:hypothetical protein F4778DRAFT_736940 [Xylariomycetidae sp. FL2044]
MPPGKQLFDFGTRQFICRSCLTNLRKRRPLAQPPIRYSSQTAQANNAPPSTSTSSSPSASASASRSPFTPDEHAERQRTLETLGLVKKDKDVKVKDVKVNYYEQEKDGRLRRLSNNDEFDDSFNDPDGSIDSRLKMMEQYLEQAVQVSKTFGNMDGERKAGRLRHHFAQQLSQDASRISHVHDPAGHVSRLRGIMKQAIMNVEWATEKPDRIGMLWKTYAAARRYLASNWQAVSPLAWDSLWQVFTVEHKYNPNRIYHISRLVKDMRHAGVPITPQQQLSAIEAMFIDGFVEEAFENHRRLVATFGEGPDAFDFWHVGLRMHCLAGKLDRAESILNMMLAMPNKEGPRLVMPFIRACAGTPSTVDKAFQSYRQMRHDLGTDMTIEDYDEVISYFLASNQAEYALYIFVDMMTSGSIDLYNLPTVPPSVGNTFFIGKWLKRLIGIGDLEGAYKVILLAKRKGLEPRPIHVNGLIGAWLRSQTAQNMAKAERVAWCMINSRIQFVQQRKQMQGLDRGIRIQQSGEGWPRATLETFSLLAESYNEREIHPKMEELWSALRAAELAADSFMMNQLLFSYLKSGQGGDVAQVCRGLTDLYKIEPDSWTFMALWQALAVNRLTLIAKDQIPMEIAQTRALFAQMVESSHVFREGTMDVFLARRVFHSFRKLKDHTGLLLAHRGLRHIFNFSAPDSLVIELLVDTQDLERLGRTHKGRWLLIEARKHIERYMKHRHKEMVESGTLKDGEGMSEDVLKQELNNFLELYIQLKIPTDADGNIEQSLTQGAQEMGLYNTVGQIASPSQGEDVPSVN